MKGLQRRASKISYAKSTALDFINLNDENRNITYHISDISNYITIQNRHQHISNLY